MATSAPELAHCIERPDPSTAKHLPRRRFLGRLVGGAAAGVLFPHDVLAAGAAPGPPGGPEGSLPAAAGPGLRIPTMVDEAFWSGVKARFPLHPERISMNAANLCPTPTEVTETLSALAREIDADQSFQNRDRFGGMRDEARAALAAYLGAHPDEVALVRNTSEGNNIVSGGLDLGPGDEVVLWDQNHASNLTAWQVCAERRGFSARTVATPAEPSSPAELLGAFTDAMGPRTRVLALTHLSNVTGVRLPAADICREARDRGILTHVDGAQTFGADDLDLHALGCDFFTGSAHKWFVGPKEVGVLYVRSGVAERVWPGVVSVGWAGARDRGALRFETLGQRDDARLAAMRAAVEFHTEIGPARIEARIGELASALRDGIRAEVPDAHFVTPARAELSGGVLIFSLPGVDTREGYEALYREHGIGGAAMADGIRLCPHVYNTLADVRRAAAAVAAVARSG